MKKLILISAISLMSQMTFAIGYTGSTTSEQFGGPHICPYQLALERMRQSSKAEASGGCTARDLSKGSCQLADTYTAPALIHGAKTAEGRNG